MSDTRNIEISRTADDRWLVTVAEISGRIIDRHTLDEKPSAKTVRALLQDADEHHDALERLVNR